MLALLHPGLEGVTDVDTDPKGRFAPSNNKVLCVYVPPGHSIRKQLTRKCFYDRLQNYMENKNKENENKIILGDFNCTMENKAQRVYRCCFNYVLSKLIKNNELEDL